MLQITMGNQSLRTPQDHISKKLLTRVTLKHLQFQTQTAKCTPFEVIQNHPFRKLGGKATRNCRQNSICFWFFKWFCGVIAIFLKAKQNGFACDNYLKLFEKQRQNALIYMGGCLRHPPPYHNDVGVALMLKRRT